MADNLIFPVKFDLEAAVKDAQGDAGRLLRRLQTTINSKPLAVNLKIGGAGSGSINEINIRLRELVKQWNSLTEAQRITNKITGEYTAEAKKILAEYTRLRGASESYAQSLKQIDSAAKKAARQQEKLAEAAYRGSNAFKNQETYVSRLLKRMAVYAGFSMVSGFLTNVREVTAQFELQRISLGAIIQDQQRANQLFAEIKSFALTSPLKILDLTKYTKQVAAYGIETEKLFGTTKMLADISVGLGVSLDRLALFYGQVSATGYLRASEVRQATEAGIPLVDKLAKKLSEANGKLVSAAEVMDLISKRAISFEQVEEVFKDMTSAGGEFYNMQVKQSQTLFGMWSKLGDAAAIMYDQIGNTSSINAGMKMTIRLLESMMRNWKTTARVLDTIAVALGVYVVGLKNAAIASKALTSAVALENLAHQQQIIRTPKVVAGMIGINNAKKISTLLTNLHTKAVLGEAAATNVLTKGFWKLTAAMLANPWVAAAAAIGAVAAALIHFIGNTETAAERVEKLNNSVASLKNLRDTTEPLITTYNELINNTERTAEEQKKLSAVTHELAKQYPGAVKAIGDFGEEVELAADKLNKLYGAEKQARMDNARNEFEKTQKTIRETEEEIAQLEDRLQRGVKTVMVGGGVYGAQAFTVSMSDDDKSELLSQLDELRAGLINMKDAAEAAEAAMMGMTVEQLHIEKFGAWKKELKSFRVEVEGGINTQLFDDSTLDQFKSLDEAMEAAAKDYKEQIELVKRYTNALENMKASEESYAKIVADRAEAEARANANLAAMTRFGYKPSDFDKSEGRGRKSDPRLQNLKEEISLVQKLYNEYKQLEKQEGAKKAAADMRRMAGDTLDMFKEKYNIDLPTDAKDLTAALEILYAKVAQLPKKVFPALDKDLKELRWTIEKVDIDESQKNIEAELKRLADRISRTKTAKEFYDKVLGMTGDYELAATFSMSVYGNTGERLKDDMVKQIESAFKSGDKTEIDLSSAINYNTKQVDYAQLRRIYDQYQDHIIDKNKETARKLIEDGEKASADQVLLWLKDLEKAKTFAEKRVELAQYTANQIAAIETSALPQDQKSEMTKRYKIREDKETAKLEYDTFKNSPMYVAMFEKLDAASTTMLENMKKRLVALKGEWKNLDPTQIKELQSRLDEVNNQLAAKNPYRTLIQSFKEWKTLREQGTRKDAEQELINKTQELERAEALLVHRIQQAEAAQKAYNDAVAEHGLFSQETQQAKLKLSFAEQQKKKQAEIVETTRESANEAENLVNSWKSLGEQVGGAWEQMDAINQAIVGLANDLKDAFGGFGSDADAQYFDDMVSSFSNLSSGITNIGKGIATGNPVAIIQGIGSAISGIVGLFTAGKVRRANKEIERQQELLDQLEYTYSRLEKAADKAFGRDYLNNYNQQLQNLQAQQAAYEKQAQAERSKGKKEDKKKTQEYLDNARDTADKIKELQDDLAAHFTGQNRTDAARQMAKSWIDARASMSDTFAAIKGDYAEMIKNMIVEGAAARVIENALSPMWDKMDEMLKDNDIDGAIDALVGGMDSALNAANNGMEVLWKALEARGYDMKQLIGDVDSSYTGIAKEVSSATSEEINANTAALNTQNYYMSHVPQIAEHVAAMRQLMERATTTALPEASAAGWTDWQQQAMDNYNAIARNTAETVVRCERAAVACEAFAADIHRMIEFSGGKHRLNVKL